MPDLTYRTFVSAPLAMALPPTPSGPAMTSPITTTLIAGARDAILIDPPVTTAQADGVADWVDGLGLRPTFIVSTHGHADHWFSTERLLQRFPDARPVATAGTVATMAVQGSPEFRAQSYDAMLPGQVGDTTVVATAIDHPLDLEGHEVRLIETGHSDTDDTSVVHVPSIDLVVGGDVVYNGVHQWLAESADDGAFTAWHAALDRVEGLGARALVAGHKDAALDDDPARVLETTRAYLRLAQQAWHEQTNAGTFAQTVLDAHPHLLGPTILWFSAQALYPAA